MQDSALADVNNVGGKGGGSCTAAAFLRVVYLNYSTLLKIFILAFSHNLIIDAPLYKCHIQAFLGTFMYRTLSNNRI